MGPRSGTPALTVVIPTRDRHDLLPEALESALAQSMTDLEVVVVDDGSDPPVTLPHDPRVRLVRLDVPRGNAAARNAGLEAAAGRWLTCLDDDDLLLPHHAETSLAAWERSTLPRPVGVVTAVAVVDEAGVEVDRRRPPSRPLGCAYSLEPIDAGQSYNAKQTLVVETAALRSVGGWDETFWSRTATELFLRLNQRCSLEGVDVVTYHLRRHPGHLRRHPGARVSRDPVLRQTSFEQLVAKHADLFAAHPRRFADLLVDHAVMSMDDRQWAAAARATSQAFRRSPVITIRRWRNLGAAARSAARPGRATPRR